MKIRIISSHPRPANTPDHSPENSRRKRSCLAPPAPSAPPPASDDLLNNLPDDLVISILCHLSSSARSPSDLLNVTMTCKKLYELVLNPAVLSVAPLKSLSVRASNWCDGAYLFLKRCSDAGNLDAYYILGMITFYVLQNHKGGLNLMAKAAHEDHADAFHSLAIINLNGSGGTRGDKNPRAAIALLSRAAKLGHLDALRELGHCVQDGYCVKQNLEGGRKLLERATKIEQALAAGFCSPIYHSVEPENHPANRFLAEWFRFRPVGDELRLCSYDGCGRGETRKHEFRKCSICSKVNYCSRCCQARDWKLYHKFECTPLLEGEGGGGGGGGGGDVMRGAIEEDADIGDEEAMGAVE